MVQDDDLVEDDEDEVIELVKSLPLVQFASYTHLTWTIKGYARCKLHVMKISLIFCIRFPGGVPYRDIYVNRCSV